MTPTQRQAIEMALEALGNTWTEPGNVQYNTETAAIQAIRAALAEQDDDKADMTIKLPPMPEPDHKFVDLEGEAPDIHVWNQASLEAYAREAVRLNIAAERERCATIADYAYSGDGPAATAARLVAARIRA